MQHSIKYREYNDKWTKYTNVNICELPLSDCLEAGSHPTDSEIPCTLWIPKVH
jgi:hypothetical protein